MKFFHGLTHRNGEASSKKVWYNGACFTATICMFWITYHNTIKDWVYICLFLAYLLTVGGFEVVLKMAQMIVDIKAGHSTTTTSTTTKETNNASVQ